MHIVYFYCLPFPALPRCFLIHSLPNLESFVLSPIYAAHNLSAVWPSPGMWSTYKGLHQWLSTSLMLQTLDTVPHVAVTKLFLLLLRNCYLDIVINYEINI